MPENVPGKFYVGNQCTDCDLCRQIAPENFARHPNGYSYVKKQPTTREEIARCRHAIDGCCVETIHSDGDLFDWSPIQPPGTVVRPNSAPKPPSA